jgi:hypothetical protein
MMGLPLFLRLSQSAVWRHKASVIVHYGAAEGVPPLQEDDEEEARLH